MASGSSGGGGKSGRRTAASKRSYKQNIKTIGGKKYLIIGDNELPLY